MKLTIDFQIEELLTRLRSKKGIKIVADSNYEKALKNLEPLLNQMSERQKKIYNIVLSV